MKRGRTYLPRNYFRNRGGGMKEIWIDYVLTRG